MKLYDYITAYNKISKEENSYTKLNIAIMRSFTCEMLDNILKVDLHNENFNAHITFGGFNQFYQEAMSGNSFLYTLKPDIIIFAVRIEDFYPIIFDNYYYSKEELSFHINKIISYFSNMLNKINSQINTNIIIQNFSKPYFQPDDIFMELSLNGVNNIIRTINLKLAETCSKYNNTSIININDVLIELGKTNCYDLKMWQVSKNPFTFKYYNYISKLYVKYINAIYGVRKKCIVLDLDNTLWKGIAGECGYNGIEVFEDFQKQLLFLNRTGILLAINSKNNLEDVLPIIKNHPDMVLREENFSAMKINWCDKVSNLREIADDLNIGLDSIIFIDDNPAECELIKKYLPKVDVYNLPLNYIMYPDFVKNLKNINALYLTSEDFKKAKMYKQEAMRSSLKNEALDLSVYYRELQMQADFLPASDFTIPRIAQLTQKTNQFNLTTKRYTEKNIREMIEEGYLIYSLSLSDKFGYYGITGAAVIKPENENTWIIDSFLLSCRVMSRGAEFAFFNFILEQALNNNIEIIKGIYIPTEKNKPVEHFYANLNFKNNNEQWVSNVNEINLPEYYIEVINLNMED